MNPKRWLVFVLLCLALGVSASADVFLNARNTRDGRIYAPRAPLPTDRCIIGPGDRWLDISDVPAVEHVAMDCTVGAVVWKPASTISNAVMIDPETGLIESPNVLPFPELITAEPGPGTCSSIRHTMLLLVGDVIRWWSCPNGAGSNPFELQGRPGMVSFCDHLGACRTLDEINPNGTFSLEAGTGVSCIVGGTNPVVTYTCSLTHPLKTLCIPVYDAAAALDNQLFFSFNYAVTITAVWCNYQGSAPSVIAQFQLEDGSNNVMTHTPPTCTAPGTVATIQGVSAANVLTAREVLRYDVTNIPNPTTDTYLLCASISQN